MIVIVLGTQSTISGQFTVGPTTDCQKGFYTAQHHLVGPELS